MKQKTFFAVIENDSRTIYGVGNDADEATWDAERWADDLDELSLVKCTEAVADYVMENGGQGPFVYTDENILDVSNTEETNE